MEEKRYSEARWYLALCILCAVAGAFASSWYIEAAALVMVLLTPLFYQHGQRFYFLLLMSYYLLDQLTFQFMGSTIRLYFFSSFLMLLLFMRYWNLVLRSTVMKSLTLWLALGVVLGLFAAAPGDAVKTFLGVILQALTAFSVFLLLASRTLTLQTFEKYLYGILMGVILFGFVQFAVYRATGVALSLSPSNAAVQLALGQIPSFRYEANAHGKLVSWAVLFSLPSVIRQSGRQARKYWWLLGAAILSSLVSMTRAAFYAMLIAVAFAALWYIYHKKGGKLTGILTLALFGGGALFVLLLSGVISLEGYSLYKLKNLFLNVQEVAEDGSGGLRLRLITEGLRVWTANWKNFLMGTGYGQAMGDVGGWGGITTTEVGGCTLVLVAVSFGIVGLVCHLRVFWNVFKYGAQKLKKTQGQNEERLLWVERMVFCAAYGLALQVFTDSMLSPEYWMIFGIMGFLELGDSYRFAPNSAYRQSARVTVLEKRGEAEEW